MFHGYGVQFLTDYLPFEPCNTLGFKGITYHYEHAVEDIVVEGVEEHGKRLTPNIILEIPGQFADWSSLLVKRFRWSFTVVMSDISFP